MTELNTPIVTDIDRPILVPPGGHKKVLLHSCCAPCSGEVMEAMLASGIDYTIYFYNPNIHPLKEYMLRKEENMRFADKFGIPFIDKDDDYENDRKEWFAKAKGMEFEPERGIRCTMCFDMRFEKAAQYAHENGFPVFTSSLGISRWKNMAQINDCGHRAAAHHHVTARRRIPRAPLIDARKAGIHQALRHDLGRVIGGRRIKEEMLIVHRVCVDLVQFKLCHTSHGRTPRGARPTIDT